MPNLIEKHRNILDFTLSALVRRRGKNSSLIVVYALVVFALGSAMFFTQAMKREASLILKDAPEMVIQRVLQGRYDPIPVAYLDKIREIRGVISVETRLWGYLYDSGPGAGVNYTFMVPRESAPPSEEIVIGNGVSRTRMVYPRDMMAFQLYNGKSRVFTVKDVISPESEIVSSDLVLVSEEDFRDVFGLPRTHATDLVVKVRNQRELPTIARKVVQLFPDTRPIIRDEMVRTYDAVFDWRGGMIIVMLSMAILAFVILAWEKASGLNAEERREIGILKAVGWETSDVILVKAYEGLFVSFFSFSLGLLCAYIHVFFFSSVLFGPALKGWSVLYPDFRLTPFVDPYQIMVLFFLTVVPYTVATIVPSWKAAIVDPDAVMRS